ncbi:MAG: 4-hydroxy-3-methylbut-2-enyl diphosphate reductase [Candidatus Cloacimonetes bacterium]|nr:4-hydroxy-3-methylbut-2-enyl diphosphate reductase [Candidatus Cloacimonadota bacterium]
MLIRLARHSGFCFGVKRAINSAMKAAADGDNIVTLGPIIHNPQMVERLAEHGIGYVDGIEQLGKGDTAIIRSHGVTRETLRELEQKNVKIIDATCPHVSGTQQFTRQLKEEGYTVLILGNREHPEVIALQSYADGEAIIVASADEFIPKNYARLGIISQTTQPLGKLQELVTKAVPCCGRLLMMNTICNATSIRQESTLTLAQDSDIMIVVGGHNSSNTKMLALISSRCVQTYHIEMASELKPQWFEGRERIGITAGASTPDWIIVDVYNKINEYTGDRDCKTNNVADIPGYQEE